jgi:predicted Rossmann-fold nucleotide-binding protein
MPVMPLFLFGKSFWSPLDKFYKNKMQKSLKTIKPKDRKIYKITDDIHEIVRAAEKIGHPSVNDNIYQNFSKEHSSI